MSWLKINLSLASILFLISLGLSASEINIINDKPVLKVHKTATCGCCKMWMKHMEKNGFITHGEDHQNLSKIKEKYNIEARQ